MDIGIDVDEILAGFFENLLSYHNQRNGANFRKEDITNYHLWEIKDWSLSKEETIKEVMDYYKTKMFDELPIIEKSREGTQKLFRRGHNLHIISSRPKEAEEKTISWIKSNYANIFRSFNFAYSPEKDFGKQKHEICRDKSINLIVEDSPLIARDCSENGISVLLFDYPWNNETYNLDSNPNIQRIKGWKDLLERLN